YQILQCCLGVHVLVRLKGFQKLTPVDEALQKFLAAVAFKQPKTVSLSLDFALNRVLAENVVAEVDVPRFNRSAVDGYAVSAEQTVGASQFKPKRFHLIDTSRIDVGGAKQVWTGN